MAHFAQLDENNKVLQVIVVDNQVLQTETGESEALGIEFCKRLFGAETRWIQTSYNSSFRKNYAGIGYTYMEDLDAFISPQPYDSWTFDDTTFGWVPPVPCPDTENLYQWNEQTQAWDLLMMVDRPVFESPIMAAENPDQT